MSRWSACSRAITFAYALADRGARLLIERVQAQSYESPQVRLDFECAV